MALSISQIVAVSYPAVLADMRKPANQWAESAFMRELERQGAIERRSLGPTIEAPLDYQRNQASGFLVTDLATTSLSKTEVITSASYSVAELSVPVVWSKGDDAKNPTENQKVAFVKVLLENAINSHDDNIEEAFFAASTNGFLGLPTHIPTSGQGTDGGISAVTETFWRNPADTYLADGSDIEAVLTSLWNTAAKGSGSALAPKLLVSGADAQALFESTQVALQRFVDTQELNAGAKVLAFKTARYVFSQYGGDEIYGLNPKSFQLVCSKEYFRDRGETNEINDANGFVTKIYSALQSVTNNKSRLFVADEA
jgi:hypothetical protein